MHTRRSRYLRHRFPSDIISHAVAEQVQGCNAVISCLGHVMDFKGMFGEPRKLCTDATRRLCDAIEKNGSPTPTRFILMNTVGVQNPDLDEKRTWFERGLLTLLRNTLPPHRDNETASEHLHRNVGRENTHIEWCCVRPDSLIDAELSPYDINESPTTGIRHQRVPDHGHPDRPPDLAIECRPLHDRADREFRALEHMEVRDAGHHERYREVPMNRFRSSLACVTAIRSSRVPT